MDTSPVVRGVWVLENILGTPPSPPPADVEPLDPDTRGARTIRQQLAKHRTVPACNECHRKIDPLGFALENYGPTGLWRDRYSVFDQWGQRKAEAGPKVEAAGRMPDGKAFEEIRGLKSLLLRERRDSFTRCLTEKLLTYATGRRLEPGDRPRVNLILERFATTSRGLRDLIVEIILSDAFGEN